MVNKLLKPKAKTVSSHNQDMQTLVDAVKKIKEIPFQVRLNEELARRVKLHCVNVGLSHKKVVTLALEAYLADKK